MQEAKAIIASMKNIKKGEVVSGTNGSPRRPIRRSPGEKNGIKVESKKEGQLGRLKETAEIEEVF